MARSVAERYVQLGLQIGRHEDGMVDAYFGPPELAADVEGAPPVEPRELVADAERLLDELSDGWLRDQVVGLRTYAGGLAGESIAYADEVEACYGVRPTYTAETVFAAAHERLEELLPGDGPLAERHRRWQRSTRVQAALIEPAIAAVIAAARSWTQREFGLPEGEAVSLDLVRGEPWLAFCSYQGGLRSRIEVNVDLPVSAIELLVLAVHETYPGHHAERCNKEHLLVRGRGLLEETIVLVPTPQSLVSEGIATLTRAILLEAAGGTALAAALHRLGVEFDLEQSLAVERVLEPCRWAEVNAALMLHEAGASEAATQAYLERWGLMSPDLAAHLVRFLKEPTSRSYMITYPAGRALCASYVNGDPVRFRRLLTEQIRVRDLLASG